MIGVYCIINNKNEKRYIGSSRKMQKRWQQHRALLRKNKHFNCLLQRSWNKYGEQSFEFKILEECDANDLLERERFWIENLHSFKNEMGYNFSKIPRATRLGCKASLQTLARMSASMSGDKHPNWGKKMSPEWVANMKKAVSGIPKPTSGKRKQYRVINPFGQLVVINGIRPFCRENKLSLTMMFLLVSGKRREYAGWHSPA